MTFTNPLRATWDRGETAKGAWCASPSAVVAEALATVGFDYVCADMQHGVADYSDVVPMMQAISGQGATPVVRVPANDAAIIGRVLDAGALGVIVPLVSTPEDAARAVAACRYPPLGGRSYGPVRASTVTGSKDPADLNQVICAVMVETQEGLDRVDEIAATPGVDVIYVGPADLSLALGLPPAYEHEDPVHADAVAKIQSACDRHGVVAGVHCTGGEMGARRISQGFRMTTLVNDLALVRSGGTHELAAVTGG
ncbi:HpcH/HpaI aldolase family protein [Serinicoccus sp. LYQ131]|uniref:HpcH/HpaI aldolase family protein n=1 Tax=Serinicoccus sp. LYQ131 TaxID=3378797 RepID=UPI0038543DA8